MLAPRMNESSENRLYPINLYPSEKNCWYDFRVDLKPEIIDVILSSMSHGNIGNVLEAYYGMKEELTDENGVFDVLRAERIVGGKEEAKPVY